MKPSITRAIFSMDGYCVWDPSLVTDAEGKHHLFFSRWPIDAMKEGETWSKGFEAWVTHSEVCRATAETPFGPYRFVEVVLPKRPGHWDGDVTHNPSVRRFGERYYLYYNGNQSDGEWWDHRNNQRVGVAVADRPEGPFVKHPEPIFASAGAAFPGEDPFVWCQDGRYHVLLKDQGTYYSPSHKAIVRFESANGLDWRLAEPSVFQERALVYEDSRREEVHRLERPFLYFSGNRPTAFFCGVKSHADRHESVIAAMFLQP